MIGFNDWINENKNNEKEFVKSVMDKYSKSMPPIDTKRYNPMKGLEGPFRSKSGRVVYYDPKEGKYYDRDSDMYLDGDVMEQAEMQQVPQQAQQVSQQSMQQSPQKNVTQTQAVAQTKAVKQELGSPSLTLLTNLSQAIQEIGKTDRSKADNLIRKIIQAVGEIDPSLAKNLQTKKSAFLGTMGKVGQNLSNIGKY